MKRINRKLILRVLLLNAILCLITGTINAQDLNSALKLTLSERYEDANNVYQSLLKSDSNNADVYFYYGENILKNYLSDTLSATLKETTLSARELFTKGIKADSTNKINLIGLGIVTLMETNDTIAADKYFNRVDGFPKNKKKYTEKHITLLIKLATGQLYAKHPRFKKAIAFLEKAEEAAPNNPKVPDAKGDIFMSQNDASNAIKNYNRAEYLDPKSPVYKVKIGTIYMGARNLTDARPIFEQAKEIDSTYAPIYAALGQMYSLSGYFKLSKDNYKRFLDLSGNNIPAKIKYANSLFRAKDLGEAFTVITEILQIDNSRNYLNRIAGYSAYDKKPADYNASLKYMELFFAKATPDKIIQKDYMYYGNTLLKLKQDTTQIDKGLLTLKKAFDMDTTKHELFNNIINNAYAYKRFDIASNLLVEKDKSGKATNSDLFTLGKVYYQLKKFGKADTIFGKLTQSDPGNIQAYLWQANSVTNLDPESKQGLAKPFYEQVVSKAQSDTVKNVKELIDAYSYLGSFYLFNAKPVDYNNAVKAFNKIITLDPNNKSNVIKGYISLALVASKKKDYVWCRDIYKKLTILDPSNADFKQGLQSYEKQVKAQQAAQNG